MATLIESVISCTLPVSGLSIHKDGHDYHCFSNCVKNVIIQLATSYPTTYEDLLSFALLL